MVSHRDCGSTAATVIPLSLLYFLCFNNHNNNNNNNNNLTAAKRRKGMVELEKSEGREKRGRVVDECKEEEGNHVHNFYLKVGKIREV